MNTANALKNAHGGARLVSNLFHPWVVLAPVVTLAACQATSEPLACTKWALLTFCPALVAPLCYASVRSFILSQYGTRQRLSRSLVRDNPGQLFIMTGLFGIPPALILYYLNEPKDLIVIILGITAVMFVIALVNLTYRASFHLAMVTSMLSSLWFLFGPISLITVPLIPILGISRYQLGMHTPTQIITGFFIGLVVSVSVFRGFGLAT